MSLLKKLFSKKEEPIKSNQDFWVWFQKHEQEFFDVVKQQTEIEKNFFDKLSPKLNELKEGFFFVTGMYDTNTVELVFTVEGLIKNIAFIENLVSEAPQLKGWKFTALKPPLNIADVSISMAGHKFSKEHLSFYAIEHEAFPDEIDITVVHNSFTTENEAAIANGTYVFLDNYLGELEFATTIDNLIIVGTQQAQKELIPIEKLKDFLIWREKEFIEKYEGVRQDTENDKYSLLEATLESGNGLLAIINTELLDWDSKASHPWIMNIELSFDGSNTNGMPDKKTIAVLEEIEEAILAQLKDFEGYLNIGRQTAEGVRELYFACKDFRKPSLVLHSIQEEYATKIALKYEIYKDKYWQSFNRFISTGF